ncbi:MAG: ABC transporter permease subunit [Pseudomonadota bacterium]|nr:ABC transporter permease subunit [Pseudomonadota bacterium]
MSPLDALGFGPRGWGPALLEGALMTLLVATVALLIGAAIGAGVAAAKLSGARAPAALGDAYAAIFRGVPELLIIYFVYFGSSALLTGLGHAFGREGFLGVPPFFAGAIAVGTISGAYQAELFRGAFLAIPKGELEAARACGMGSWLMFRRIVAPQVVAFALPGLNNLWQVALKDSSLISVTGLTELMRAAQVASGSTRQPFTFYLAGGALYLVLTIFSNRLFETAERRVERGRRRTA